MRLWGLWEGCLGSQMSCHLVRGEGPGWHGPQRNSDADKTLSGRAAGSPRVAGHGRLGGGQVDGAEGSERAGG